MRDDHSSIAQGDPEVDALFHALSDATRRDILRRCLDQEPSVSRLAAAYPVSITAIQKHVKVLEDAGLVMRRKRGREQLVSTRFDGLAQAHQALDRLEGTWRARIQQMDDILAGESGDALAPPGEAHGRNGY